MSWASDKAREMWASWSTSDHAGSIQDLVGRAIAETIAEVESRAHMIRATTSDGGRVRDDIVIAIRKLGEP